MNYVQKLWAAVLYRESRLPILLIMESTYSLHHLQREVTDESGETIFFNFEGLPCLERDNEAKNQLCM
jgi:hypothetical protein